jgi:Sulfatase
LLLSLLLAAAPRPASAVRWGKLASPTCEPPNPFYTSAHQNGRTPCCPTQPGVCPGGVACPASGVCPVSNARCLPVAARTRPNVILIISDDQGECHYGTAGECRSAQTGTPIPPASTPNLDVLAAYGTMFPIAHNTASWCFPSLNSMLTGRYQKSFEGSHDLSGDFLTVPQVLRSLEGEAGAIPDPFLPASSIGGYCSLLAGKFTGTGGKVAFDAQARLGARRLGKLPCISGGAGQPPLCGTERLQSYDPLTLFNIRDLFQFMDAMFYPVPGAPGTFTNQPFFIWYAPRIPHAPLRAPDVIDNYLFGTDRAELGGLFQLGAMCRGGACPAAVSAFSESNFGTERQYYSNVWWVDDNVREIRKYLAHKSAPHCILPGGQSRLWALSPAQCGGGTWVTDLAPPVDTNTVLIYLSDNGWFLPDSKHSFTENGYRTRLFVYDPRAVQPAPPWQAPAGGPPPPTVSAELAHSTDLLPTILGYALDTPVDTPGGQSCPVSRDGNPCDGHDLRPYLLHQATGDPAAQPPTTPLRHSLCGHHTQRGTAPTRQRYLLTRPGSVGRCVDVTLPACATAADCKAGEICLGGHCEAVSPTGCNSSTQCATGSICLGGKCRVGPPCIDAATCVIAYSSFNVQCAEQATKWCRNAPNIACSTAADCPACPAPLGPTAPPCGRVCETQQLKLYLGADPGGVGLVDLFLDPDERGRHIGEDGPLFAQMSSPAGPYGPDLRRLSCCIDAWWPDGARGGTLCRARDACPADFTCNQ